MTCDCYPQLLSTSTFSPTVPFTEGFRFLVAIAPYRSILDPNIDILEDDVLIKDLNNMSALQASILGRFYLWCHGSFLRCNI